jgi:uncharacterized protein YkwD
MRLVTRSRPKISPTRLAASTVLLALAAPTAGRTAEAVRDGAAGLWRVERCARGQAAAELHETLDAAAAALARGERLSDTLDRADDRVSHAQAVYLKGPVDDATIGRLVAEHYCTSASDAPFTDVGLHRRGDEAWLVFAARVDLPAAGDSAAVAERVLALVNAARTVPRRCGDRRFDAAPPLELSPALTDIAALHARDMARHGVLSHRGSDGSEPGERVARAGYDWRALGENVASGQPDAEEVVAGWLGSAGHCANIMEPQFTEMGVAFALAPDDDAAIYWAQTFAKPR